MARLRTGRLYYSGILLSSSLGSMRRIREFSSVKKKRRVSKVKPMPS